MGSSILDRVKAFLPVMAQENHKLQQRLQSEGAEAVCLEDLVPMASHSGITILSGGLSADSGSESDDSIEHATAGPVISMDLGLGVFDLKDDEAVAAAERACSQPGAGTSASNQSEASDAGILQSPSDLLACLRQRESSAEGGRGRRQDGKATGIVLPGAGVDSRGRIALKGSARGRGRGKTEQRRKVEEVSNRASPEATQPVPDAGVEAATAEVDGGGEETQTGCEEGVPSKAEDGAAGNSKEFLLRPVTTRKTS